MEVADNPNSLNNLRRLILRQLCNEAKVRILEENLS